MAMTFLRDVKASDHCTALGCGLVSLGERFMCTVNLKIFWTAKLRWPLKMP